MTKPLKLYIVAGEASGDLIGGLLVRELHARVHDIEVRAWGGDQMADAGAMVVKHYRDLAFMGFWEVVKNLRTILLNFKAIKSDIITWQPDAVVLIDYPGFNLRLARWLKQQGIKVIYYVSPQIWAWHASRAHQVREHVDLMLTILPFEREFYKRYDMDVQFVGHPLLDVFKKPETSPLRTKSILLMPGSRQQEVERLLPLMLEAVKSFQDYDWIVAGVSNLPAETYLRCIESQGLAGRVSLRIDQSHALMQTAALGLIKSGTSTLEAALLGLPQVVCYKGSSLSYKIAKRVIRVPYISLVNLVLNRPLIVELIQSACTPGRMATELRKLHDPKRQAEIMAGYADLRGALGTEGASKRAALEIIREVSAQTPSHQ